MHASDEYNEYDRAVLFEMFKAAFPSYSSLPPEVIAEADRLAEQTEPYDGQSYMGSPSSTAGDYMVIGLGPDANHNRMTELMEAQSSAVGAYMCSGSSESVLTPLVDARPTGEFSGLVSSVTQSMVKSEGSGRDLHPALLSPVMSDITQMLVDFDRELSNVMASSHDNYSSPYLLPQTAAIPATTCSSDMDMLAFCRSSSADSPVQSALQDMVNAIMAPSPTFATPVLNSQCSSYCRTDSSSSDDLDSVMQVINSWTVAV
jgi:hypothetical protein